MAVRRLQLIALTLTAATQENCRCYECDTIDALLGDIAHHWDLSEQGVQVDLLLVSVGMSNDDLS